MTRASPVAEPSEPASAYGLFGRTRELCDLEQALADVERGRGRLVLLAGEPGIGKTTLADAASALAQRRGFTVHWGRCWESGGAPAYWPWLGVLAAMARALDDASLAGALGDGAAVVAEILPELRARLPPNSTGAPPPPEEARFRVFRAIVALAEQASHGEAHGLVIVLDDLHAADRSSLLLLHFLARELRRLKVLVIATYRDVEARVDAETGELIQRIVREGTSLALPRLASTDATELVRARGGPVAEPVRARIVERAQGNPLFLAEMLHLLVEQGPESIEAGVVPHGVRDVIGQRLARVSAETRALLELAAVAGDELEPSLLAAAAAESNAVVLGALAEARRAGVVGARGERQRFAHALFREVLYRELAPARRRELHGRVAHALEVHGVTAEAVPRAKLAHHALEGPPELAEHGVEHALRAAQQAQELLAYDDAVEMLERALATPNVVEGPAVARAKLLLALAEACIRRGDATSGKRCCREAAAIARAAGDSELGARAALAYGRVFVFGAVDPVLVGMLESSLEALPTGDSALRARLLGRLAGALQPSLKMEEPIAFAREAIATARRLGDRKTLLEVLNDAISAMMDCAPPAEALALTLEAEELSREFGDRERLLRMHGRLFFLHLSFAELELADERIEAYETLASELLAPWLGYRCLFFRAVRATMQGRFAEAERLLAEARQAGQAVRDASAEVLYFRSREGLLRARERLDELIAPDSMAQRERPEVRYAGVWLRFHAGLAYARREELERVRDQLRHLPAEYPRNFFSFFFLTEMAAVAGTDEEAEALYRLVEACPDEYLTLGWSYAAWEGPRSRFLALLLGRLRRYEAASAAFEDAVARLTKLGALPLLARTEYEYARMLLERGAPADLARARELLCSARARAEPLDMAGLVAHVDRRLATLAATPKPHTEAPKPAARASLGLLLEGEYFRLSHGDVVLRMKDTLGLRYLARLLEVPGRELHVLDLVREGKTASDAGELGDAGDAGEHLDEAARASYRRRLEDLRDTLAEAESFGDTARANKAREELEFLGRELGRAVGLGGSARRAGVAAERARSAVQRRIRHAIERIAAQNAPLADFLERSVRTGNYCVFIPVPD
ncbi:MAG TPA: AAA family ATPase [Polyangiaceae bacterium]|nr:AAA family ATPase [Polyangiaceae bacterium]